MDQCVRDAIFHLDCAKQALEASLTDPEGWKQDAMDNARVLVKVLPVMTLLSSALPRTRTYSDPNSVENLLATHGECQSDANNSEPEQNFVA